MDYGNILSRALNIVKKHKALWLFGLLASCASGGGVGGGSRSASFNNGDFSSGNNPLENINIPDEFAIIFIALLCFFFILAIIFYFVAIVGRVGLIKGTTMAEESDEKLQLGDVFQEIKPFLLRAIGLNLFITLATIAGFIILLIVLIPLTLLTLGLALICFAILLIPFVIFISIVIEQANIALIVEDLDIFEALKRGLQVSKDNLGSMLVMGLILIIGVGLAIFVVSLPFLFIILPAIIGYSFDTEFSLGSGFLIAAICLVAYLPVFIFIRSLLLAFMHSAWTLTYLELTDGSDKISKKLPAAT